MIVLFYSLRVPGHETQLKCIRRRGFVCGDGGGEVFSHVFFKAAANTWAAVAEPRAGRIWGMRGGTPPPVPLLALSAFSPLPPRAVGERCGART